MMRIFFMLVLVFSGLLATSAGRLSAAEVPGGPVFDARFLGSYGFLSGREPQISAEESELLKRLLPLIRENKTTEALVLLRPRVTTNSSAALDFLLGNLYFQSGQEQAAAQAYRIALDKFPDFVRARDNLGLLLVSQGRYEEAQPLLAKVIALGGGTGRTYGLLGYCYLETDFPLAAQLAYQNAVMLEPEVRDWQLGLAKAWLAQERYHEAAALFGELIMRNPDETDYWLLQANAWLALGDNEKAMVNLEALRLAGKAPPAALGTLANLYFNAGLYARAAPVYREALRTGGPAQAGNALQAADVMVQLNRIDEARALAADLHRMQDHLERVHHTRLLVLEARLAIVEGDNARARKLLETALEQNPRDGGALLALGRLRAAAGDAEGAILLFQRAAAERDHRFNALVEEARVRVERGDYQRALPLIEAALEERSSNELRRFLREVRQAAGMTPGR